MDNPDRIPDPNPTPDLITLVGARDITASEPDEPVTWWRWDDTEMAIFTVCVIKPPRCTNPVGQTPGFPSLFGVGKSNLMVVVQPLHLLPDGDQVEQYLLSHERVQIPSDGLSVVEFRHKDGSVAADNGREAAHLWCRFARLVGWRVWQLPHGGGLPLHEVGDGEVGVALLGQGEFSRLVVAKRSPSGSIWSRISTPEEDAA